MSAIEFIRKRSNLEKGVAIFIAILIVLAVLFAAGVLRNPGPGHKTTDHEDVGAPNVTSALDAFDAASKVALDWHADAILSSLSSNRAAVGDPVNNWRFIFISNSVPGKGFLVDVLNTAVTNTQEVSYSGTAAPVPDNIISQGEAVRRVHAMSGYANQPVIGMEAVYDQIKRVWFWAVRTPIGIVSIEADK